MAGTQDAPLPSDLAAVDWANVVSSPPRDGELWPTTDPAPVAAPPPGALAGIDLGTGISTGGITAAEGPSSLLAGFGAPWLGLTEWTSGSSVVVSVAGELDIATTAQLSDALGAALRRGVKGLVCDLTGVTFLGAAGVTTLLVARRRAVACHAWFDLVCPQPLPRKVIALLSLDAVFNVYDCVAEGVGAQARHVDRAGRTTAPKPKGP